MTQQNAAMVEESTAASRSLAQEAEKLTSLVGQFKTGQEIQARAPQSQASIRSMARQVPAWSAAARRQIEPETEGWEEF